MFELLDIFFHFISIFLSYCLILLFSNNYASFQLLLNVVLQQLQLQLQLQLQQLQQLQLPLQLIAKLIHKAVKKIMTTVAVVWVLLTLAPVAAQDRLLAALICYVLNPSVTRCHIGA